MRRLSERMLLTVGVSMTLLSVTLAAGVAAAVGGHGEKSAVPTGHSSTELRAAREMKQVTRKYNPGKKLEIDRTPVESSPSRPEPPPVEPPPPPPLPPPPPAPPQVELPPPPPPSVPEHGPKSTKPVQKHQPQPAPKPPPTKGQQVLEEAKRYMGVRYRIGGASRSGVDCSGLTMLAYKKFGVSLPHHVKKQYQYGYWVRGEPKAGDLVFFDEHGRGISHVGIATGRGTIIHASDYWRKVTETNIKYIKGYKGAKRLL